MGFPAVKLEAHEMDEKDRVAIAVLEANARNTDANLARLEGKVDAGFAELKTEMKSGFQRLDSGIDRLDGRIDRLDGRIDEVDKRLSAEMKSGFQRLDGRIDKLDARIDEVDKRLGGRIDKLDAKVDVGFAETRKEIQRLDTKIDGVKDSIASAKIWALVLYIALAAALLGAMTKGFLWLADKMDSVASISQNAANRTP